MEMLHTLFFGNAGLYSISSYILLFLVLTGILILSTRTKQRYSSVKEKNKCESPIESMLFDSLLEQGYEVYTQVPCGSYRIDLVIYAKNRKIAIEADGKKFHSSAKQRLHDKGKDYYLQKNGWDVVRFSGSEIYKKRKECVQEILQMVKTA